MSDHAELIRRLRIQATAIDAIEPTFSPVRVADLLREAANALGAGPAREPQTWQPIETAPRDETRVLLYRNQGAFALFDTGFYAPFDDAGDDDSVGCGGWNWRWLEQPTHWMPLPSAPSPSPTTEPQG